ncbi:unnamed protein product [Pseudo-nitzschia multistriata]|uniref:Fungal lipase-type domain-containing protein n=1 Tax=Pseudo-nitzschia multistriata TaxID=183589 RepID=A0A448ZS49_9STRA|nr:unnamed protein product [Pseudo-nitzschia multistriata]
MVAVIILFFGWSEAKAGGKPTAVYEEGTDLRGSSTGGSYNNTKNGENDDNNSAKAKENKANDEERMKKFLEAFVFGQKDTALYEGKNDLPSHHQFLSMLQTSEENNGGDGSSPHDHRTNETNVFVKFWDGLAGALTKEISGADAPFFRNEQNEEDIDEVLAKVLGLAKLLVEEEASVTAVEFSKKMWVALKQVARQLSDTFGEVMNHLDAYFPLAIPYYAMQEDSKKSPMWKRKMHRFYQGVKKPKLIELHDALYLSHLAYVDTRNQFEVGLRAFQNNTWLLLYGNTQSLPDIPANFMVIHKELAPLKQREKKGNKLGRAFHSLAKKSFLKGVFAGSTKLVKQQLTSEVLVTIVVRGTKEVADVLSDGLLEPRSYREGLAHGGMLVSGTNLAAYYLPKLVNLHNTTQRDKVRVVLIGHSLGAGTAAIAAMELKKHDFLEVEAVGFGCPSLLSHDLAVSTKDYITTVINDADIVPRLSGPSMANLMMDLIEYDWTEEILEDIRFSLQRAKEAFPDFRRHLLPDTEKVLQWFREHLRKNVKPKKFYENSTASNSDDGRRRTRLPSVLSPPGRCIHLFRDGYGVTGTFVPCDIFSSVDFSVTAIDDHMIPTGYDRALLAAAQDTDRDYTFRFANDINSIVGV